MRNPNSSQFFSWELEKKSKSEFPEVNNKELHENLEKLKKQRGISPQEAETKSEFSSLSILAAISDYSEKKEVNKKDLNSSKKCELQLKEMRKRKEEEEEKKDQNIRLIEEDNTGEKNRKERKLKEKMLNDILKRFKASCMQSSSELLLLFKSKYSKEHALFFKSILKTIAKYSKTNQTWSLK